MQLDNNPLQKALCNLNDKNLDIKFFLMWKKNGKNKKMLFSYGITDDFEKEDWLDRIRKDYLDRDSPIPYNILHDKIDRICFISTDDVVLAKEYINSVSDECNEKVSPKYISDLEAVRENLNYVKGYCVKVTDLSIDKSFYLYGRVTNFKSLKKSNFLGMGNVTKNEITKLTDSDQIIGIYPITTCIIIDNNIYINKRKAFEDLFGLLEQYKIQAKSVVEKMSNNFSDFFIGMDKLKEDLDSKPIYARSLVNFEKYPARLKAITEHIEEIKKLKDNPVFKEKYKNLEVTKKSIVYTTETISEFLSILNEKPVQSLITKDEFLAERDE